MIEGSSEYPTYRVGAGCLQGGRSYNAAILEVVGNYPSAREKGGNY